GLGHRRPCGDLTLNLSLALTLLLTLNIQLTLSLFPGSLRSSSSRAQPRVEPIGDLVIIAWPAADWPHDLALLLPSSLTPRTHGCKPLPLHMHALLHPGNE